MENANNQAGAGGPTSPAPPPGTPISDIRPPISELRSSTPKRILLVVPVYASYHSFLRELGDALVDTGWEVCVACNLSVTMGQDYDRAHMKRIRFCDFKFPRGANPVAHMLGARQLRKIIREIQPTLIHAHFSAAILTTALAVRRNDPAIAIGTFQGLQFPLLSGFKRRLYRMAEVFSSKRLDGVWVLTRDDLEALQAAGVEQAHIQETFGFGCRIDHFDPERFSEADRAQLREKHNIPADAKVFIYVGRNVAFKGFHLVVNAFLRLLKSEPNIRLLIVGDLDPLHPSGLTPEGEAAMIQTPEIIRCGWQKDVAPYLAIADVMVHPSAREGMPVGCMEALAMGLPLVAPDARGTREMLDLFNLKSLEGLKEHHLISSMRKFIEQACSHDERAFTSLKRPFLNRANYLLEQIEIYKQAIESE